MSLRARLSQLQLALMLMTRLPAGRITEPAPAMGASAWAWALAGVPVGLLAALGYGVGFVSGLPALACAVLAVTAAIFATGGLHEDGLADLADGLGGGRDRPRKLEIMRDSRVGSYGVLALVLSVGMRVVLIAELPPGWVAYLLVASAVASRAALPVIVWLLPPARLDGLGRGASSVGVAGAAMGALIGLIALFALPLAVCGVVLGAALVAWLAWRQIGGQTGDVLGAAQQAGEIGALMIAVALL